MDGRIICWAMENMEREGRKEICDIEGHYNKRLGIVSSCLVKTDRLLSSDIAKLKAAYMEKRNT